MADKIHLASNQAYTTSLSTRRDQIKSASNFTIFSKAQQISYYATDFRAKSNSTRALAVSLKEELFSSREILVRCRNIPAHYAALIYGLHISRIAGTFRDFTVQLFPSGILFFSIFFGEGNGRRKATFTRDD